MANCWYSVFIIPADSDAMCSTFVGERTYEATLLNFCPPPTQGYIESGLFKFTYGSKDSLVDFLHGDNFCQAHIKAAEAMEDPASPVVCYSADCVLYFQKHVNTHSGFCPELI